MSAPDTHYERIVQASVALYRAKNAAAKASARDVANKYDELKVAAKAWRVAVMRFTGEEPMYTLNDVDLKS